MADNDKFLLDEGIVVSGDGSFQQKFVVVRHASPAPRASLYLRLAQAILPQAPRLRNGCGTRISAPRKNNGLVRSDSHQPVDEQIALTATAYRLPLQRADIQRQRLDGSDIVQRVGRAETEEVLVSLQ